MPPKGGGGYEEINEAVREEWVEETTPYQRVRDVIKHIYQPVTAETVANEAETTPKTARKHLKTLAKEGFVSSEEEGRATGYYRSPESIILQNARDILTESSIEELRSQISEMRSTIQQYQERTGVKSPEQLEVDVTNRYFYEEANSMVFDEEQPITPQDLTEWETTQRNLAIANAALSIGIALREVGPETPANI